MGTKYPEAAKDFARKLFLEGYSFPDIAKAIRERHRGKAHESMIYRWAEGAKPTWREQRENRSLQVVEKVDKDAVQSVLEATDEHIKAYKQLREKGTEALPTLEVKKVADASTLIDVGIKGERRIAIGLVSARFVQVILSILREEIKDDELLRRIGLRLVGAAGEFQTEEK